MNKPRRFTGLALSFVGVVAAALPVLALAPAAAAAQREPAAPAKILTCRTDTDGWTGHAHCTNNASEVRAFRAEVVCGAWPDAVGAWKTLRPGESNVSSARCFGGTGVGSVTWQEG
ncbi:hypothetical protein ACFWBR_19265 [Streptomyces sp. NPDC060006]|uniref:hypothetical protein n=1 Tax=unclassified Streptomyces TaxID=2593676 RepID=UPI0036340E44